MANEEPWETGFDDWVRNTSRQRIEILSAVAAGLLAAAFVVGRIVLSGRPQDGPGMRWLPVQIGVCLATFLSIRYWSIGRRYPNVVASGFFTLLAATVARHLSELGGFDGPYFYAVYILAPTSIVFTCNLYERVWLIAAPVTAFLLTYFLPHRDYLSYPMLHIPVLTLISNTTMCLVLGHNAYRTMRERYRLGVELDAEKLRHARELERRRLARTLHDDFGQLLTGARMELDGLERSMKQHTSSTLDLSYMRHLLDSLSETARAVVEELREPRQSDEPLADGLTRLFASLERHPEIQLTHSIGHPSLEEQHREVAFRVVQESLTNIIKHAHATKIHVRVEQQGSRLVVSVEDDGRGFDPAVAPRGFGLRGLRERVVELGGELDVTSDHKGTRIVAHLPLVPEPVLAAAPTVASLGP